MRVVNLKSLEESWLSHPTSLCILHPVLNINQRMFPVSSWHPIQTDDGWSTNWAISPLFFSSLSLAWLHPDMSRWFIFGLFPAIDCHLTLSFAISTLFLQTINQFVFFYPFRLICFLYLSFSSSPITLAVCFYRLYIHSDKLSTDLLTKGLPLISMFYSFIAFAKFFFAFWI